jgi:hypothetical protein
MRMLLVFSLVAAGVVVSSRPALAQNEPAAPPIVHKRIGAGYKIGNGLGFVGGDLIIAPVEHLSLDLQANWFSAASGDSSASGYGLAPALQFHLFDGQVSSPYAGVGYIYATLSLDGVTASAQGVFANVGYEWRWDSGFGILLGGGVGHLGAIRATNGVQTVEAPGGTHFNLEVGFRFMFL